MECLLSENCPSDTNYFTIMVQPNGGFSLELNTKIPGEKNGVIPVNMNFSHNSRFGLDTLGAYGNLLDNVLRGDQSVFVRNDEIEYAWKVVDKVLNKKYNVYQYQKGSKGPSELREWSRRHRLQWRT